MIFEVMVRAKVKVASVSNISVSYCGRWRHAHRHFGVEVSSCYIFKLCRVSGSERVIVRLFYVHMLLFVCLYFSEIYRFVVINLLK